MRRSCVLLGGALLASGVVASACSQQLLRQDTQLGGPLGEQCPNVKRPNEPSVVSWDVSALSSLKSRMSEGGVVVRYSVEGCKAELEPLPDCVVSGVKYKYQWSPGTEKIEAHSSREVFAELPLGAGSLAGKLAGGKVLRVPALHASRARRRGLPVGRGHQLRSRYGTLPRRPPRQTW